MNRRTCRRLTPGLLALLMLVAFAACDSASTSDEGVAEELVALESTLTQELGLSSAQQQDLDAAFHRFRGRNYEPGVLWELAAELQTTLTDEQKQRLFDRTGRMHRDSFCPAGRFQQSGFGWRGFGEAGCLGEVLTDEQRDALAEIRESYRAQIEDLIESKRNGDLSPEAFREQMQAIHEAVRAEIDALLTDDQRDALEACRAERQAEREAEIEAFRAADRDAMITVLGLTENEAATVIALMDEHKADVEALFEQLQDGSLDCEGFQEALNALREAFDEALQDVLDETQWEIVLIHRALSHHGRPFGHRLGMGVFGGFGGFGLMAGDRGPGGPHGHGPGGR